MKLVERTSAYVDEIQRFVTAVNRNKSTPSPQKTPSPPAPISDSLVMRHHADPHVPPLQRLLNLRAVVSGYISRRVLQNATEAPFCAPEDLTQETLTRAVAGLATFDQTGGELRAWLFGIASHVVADAERARALRNRRFARAPLDLEIIPSTACTPDQTLAARQSLERVIKAFLTMPEHWQIIVVLVGMDGESHAHVAKLLGISPDASKKHLERARAYLEKKSGIRRKDLRFAFPFLFRDEDGNERKPGIGFYAGSAFAVASALLLSFYAVQYERAQHAMPVLEPISLAFKHTAILIEPLQVEPTPAPPPIAPIQHAAPPPTHAHRSRPLTQKQQPADNSSDELDTALSQLGRTPVGHRQ